MINQKIQDFKELVNNLSSSNSSNSNIAKIISNS